jgi:hypothetical protein
MDNCECILLLYYKDCAAGYFNFCLYMYSHMNGRGISGRLCHIGGGNHA